MGMNLTIHLPADDFDEALDAIEASFQRGEITITPHKKRKTVSVEVADSVHGIHQRILHACPDARIEESPPQI